MERFYAYVLYSEDFDRLYIGQTNNIMDRIKRHNSGYEDVTKPYRPWKVVYCDICESRGIAVQREKFWKLSQNRRKIRTNYINSKLMSHFEYQISALPAYRQSGRSEGQAGSNGK